MVKSSTERVRKFRERQRALRPPKKQSKTALERLRKYRAKRWALKRGIPFESVAEADTVQAAAGDRPPLAVAECTKTETDMAESSSQMNVDDSSDNESENEYISDMEAWDGDEDYLEDTWLNQDDKCKVKIKDEPSEDRDNDSKERSQNIENDKKEMVQVKTEYSDSDQSDQNQIQSITNPIENISLPSQIPSQNRPCSAVFKPTTDSHPILFFDLFFSSAILNIMVRETNKHAQEFITKQDKPVSAPLSRWKNVTPAEMKGFIACVLNMDLNKKPTIKCYWNTLPSQNIPWFGKMFSKHRFSHILRFFHLVKSNGTQKKTAETENNPSSSKRDDDESEDKQCDKYWKHVAINILSKMLMNCYLAYRDTFKGQMGKAKTKHQFIVEIIEKLGSDWQASRGQYDDTRGMSGLVKLPTRKESQCCVCSTKDRRRRSRTVCSRCNRGLHADCFLKHTC